MGGACVSKEPLTPEEQRKRREEKIQSKWIDQSLEKDKAADRDSIKLLFLGAGESGKSTLLKQMNIIHGPGFNREDRIQFIALIHSNVLSTMKQLCMRSRELRAEHPECEICDEKSLKAAELLSNAPAILDSRMPSDVAEAVKILWSDPGIQRTYALRSKFQLQLNDTASYFFNNMNKISHPDYMPDDSDILRSRIRTTGIVEHKFLIDDNDFRMYDVGGQRNARKKWIHCFENVTSVIFVAAVSEYDQVLYEDNRVNRLTEALNLFKDISDSEWFRQTSMILFLNKKDVFKEKIARVPLHSYFPEYNGPPNSFVDGLKFIKSEFKKRNSDSSKKIFTHFTCATDTNNIRRVFDAVKKIILRTHLIEIGLIDPEADIGAMAQPSGYDSDSKLDEEEGDYEEVDEDNNAS